MNNGISVYRGRRFDNKQRRHAQKVIVLDLDDTLGSFAHLHILWMGIVKGVRKGGLDKETFFRLFSLLLTIKGAVLSFNSLVILSSIVLLFIGDFWNVFNP